MKNIDHELIGRLRSEKRESTKQFYEMGFENASSDIHELSYDEIAEVYYSEKHYSEFDCWDSIKDQLDLLKEEYPALDEEQYMRGWIAGIKYQWERISPQL